LQATLRSDYWQNMPADTFSFAVTGLLGMDPGVAQQLLETTDTRHRLDSVLGMINGMT
jgi:hypothetical protein